MARYGDFRRLGWALGIESLASFLACSLYDSQCHSSLPRWRTIQNQLFLLKAAFAHAPSQRRERSVQCILSHRSVPRGHWTPNRGVLGMPKPLASGMRLSWFAFRFVYFLCCFGMLNVICSFCLSFIKHNSVLINFNNPHFIYGL